MRLFKYVLMSVTLCCSTNVAMAQANGDPGAAAEGQAAAQKNDQDHKGNPQNKSGATPMAKGSSGGSGGPAMRGGSNSMSGSGSTKQP